ncbi:exodeoxyribonuclease VIII [Rodentibacter genomosp. 1]|uniref:Exodeoxyribonuclease VIII n=1 Tax=Rodentibacter genomosp. 1 TaxID=1908264 RepID=A0A1V3J7S5_9PAST|nr:PD-(D/E)XK nuclease-like domain-containing protein [Rodentibacter genomosp. 1]OOF51423.1 exodeoxyribonuclease VIII [Rodentibacter genomosp. 1]
MTATVLENMSNAEYHAHSAISKSGLDLIDKSPAHYFYREKKSTPAMIFGSAFHDLVLLPDKFTQLYCVMPEELNLRTKEGKVFKEKVESENLTVLSYTDYQHIEKMKESLLNHPMADKLLAQGKPEISIFWRDSIGVECRCRPDFLNNSGIIVDLKTTTDASPTGFAKSIANFRYHVQDAYYSNGYFHAFGEPPKGFVFIAIEKEPPYAIGVYTLDDIAKIEGENRFKANLETYKNALETNQWHAFSPQIETLSLPHWAYQS